MHRNLSKTLPRVDSAQFAANMHISILTKGDIMSEAWNVFTRALSQGAQQYGSFIKIWFMTLLVLALIATIIMRFAGADAFSILATGASPELMSQEQQMELYSSVRSLGVWGFLLSIFTVIVISGLAVNSLRFYAGKYQPSWVPFQFDWGTTFAFVGWSIILGLIAAAVLIIPFLIIAWLASMAINNTSGFGMFITWLLYFGAMLFAGWMCMRLYNKLVGRALGDQITFGQAWNQTKGSAVFYLGLAIFILVTAWLYQMIVLLIFDLLFGIFTSPTMLSIIGFFFALAVIMIQIYFFAVYYAVFVEVYQKFFGGKKA